MKTFQSDCCLPLWWRCLVMLTADKGNLQIARYSRDLKDKVIPFFPGALRRKSSLWQRRWKEFPRLWFLLDFPLFTLLQLLKTMLKQTQSMKEDKANSVWLIKERPFISCVRQDARITDREIYHWDTFSWTWNMIKSGSFCANQLTDSFHFWKALVMRVMQKLSASFNIHAKFAHKLHLTFNYAALTFPLSCKFFYSEGEIRKWKSELERCFFKILTNRIWL